MKLLVLAAASLLLFPPQDDPDDQGPEPRFEWPCDDYTANVHGKSFGVHVTRKGSPFTGSWHLAEDVWKPPGTEVRAIANGVVRYSAFSPTWTDDDGFTHWNLGNVIVVEHALDPPVVRKGREPLDALCSIYVHLAADRRVQAGDQVVRGQPIGRIGKDKSEENGRYPAHLHFGLHEGPYVQISPSLVRELEAAAQSKDGLRFGPTALRGELDIRMAGETSILVTAKESGESAVLSLLVGSTAPKDPPPDIMGWCQGYGEKATLEEWIEPSRFLKTRVGTKR